ncbi:hypothetical protein B0H14DRAFT_3130526 [Mycena olivaceomarginata]|nr:hypothetical protein B0H14DRAFT_3130526 [Mycena olivaceomarginata]
MAPSKKRKKAASGSEKSSRPPTQKRWAQVELAVGNWLSLAPGSGFEAWAGWILGRDKDVKRDGMEAKYWGGVRGEEGDGGVDRRRLRHLHEGEEHGGECGHKGRGRERREERAQQRAPAPAPGCVRRVQCAAPAANVRRVEVVADGPSASSRSPRTRSVRPATKTRRQRSTAPRAVSSRSLVPTAASSSSGAPESSSSYQLLLTPQSSLNDGGSGPSPQRPSLAAPVRPLRPCVRCRAQTRTRAAGKWSTTCRCGGRGVGASGRSEERLRDWRVKTGGSPPAMRARRVAASSTEASEEREPNVSEDGARMSRPTTRSVDGGGDTEVLLSVTI